MSDQNETEPITKVIFRHWEGDVIALFPEIPDTYTPYTCESYMHMGQHSGADPHGIIQYSRPATEQEYAPLKEELESIGYHLKVIKRLRHEHYEARQCECRRINR